MLIGSCFCCWAWWLLCRPGTAACSCRRGSPTTPVAARGPTHCPGGTSGCVRTSEGDAGGRPDPGQHCTGALSRRIRYGLWTPGWNAPVWMTACCSSLPGTTSGCASRWGAGWRGCRLPDREIIADAVARRASGAGDYPGGIEAGVESILALLSGERCRLHLPSTRGRKGDTENGWYWLGRHHHRWRRVAIPCSADCWEPGWPAGWWSVRAWLISAAWFIALVCGVLPSSSMAMGAGGRGGVRWPLDRGRGGFRLPWRWLVRWRWRVWRRWRLRRMVMKVLRVIRHLLAPPWHLLRRHFPAAALGAIEAAIGESEQLHRGNPFRGRRRA